MGFLPPPSLRQLAAGTRRVAHDRHSTNTIAFTFPGNGRGAAGAPSSRAEPLMPLSGMSPLTLTSIPTRPAWERRRLRTDARRSYTTFAN